MYPDTQIPVSLKNPLHQKSDQNKTKKGENAEVGNYPGTGIYLPPNTCVMMYMSLETGERKPTLPFRVVYMSGMYVPVPVLYGRR